MTKISVHYGITINCGEMEFVRIDIGMERDLKPDEAPKDAYWEAWKEVSQQVDKRCAAAKKKMMGA